MDCNIEIKFIPINFQDFKSGFPTTVFLSEYPSIKAKTPTRILSVDFALNHTFLKHSHPIMIIMVPLGSSGDEVSDHH